MAEPENIKKTFIYFDQLPDLPTNYIRFRIVTEDGLRVSQWSNIFHSDEINNIAES